MSDCNGYFVWSVILLSLIYPVNAIHIETRTTSNPACFGTAGLVFMNLTCEEGHVIAIETIWVGAKPTTSNCPASYDETVNDTSCCRPSDNSTEDCLFALNRPSYSHYHRTCNGRQRCTVQALNIETSFGQCGSNYPATTTYAYIDFKCVADSDINSICSSVSKNTSGSYTYITSEGFPEGMNTSSSLCDCSVQTNDANVTLDVVVLQRDLHMISNVSCGQSLFLLNSSENILSVATCENNTFLTEIISVDDYVIVRLSNNETSATGSFFMEIRDSNKRGNLTVNCPALLPNATATTTTTTTTVTPSATSTTTSSTTSTSITDTTNSTNNGESTEEEGESNLLVIVLAVLAFVFFISLVITCWLWCRNRNRTLHSDTHPLTKDEQSTALSSTRGESENLQRSGEIPDAEPVAFAAPVWAGYGEDSQETNKISNTEKIPKETTDTATNTEFIVATTVDEKAIQAVVDMTNQSCHAHVQLEAKHTNTPAPRATAEAEVQTKLKRKNVGVMAIINETDAKSNDEDERNKGENKVNEGVENSNGNFLEQNHTEGAGARVGRDFPENEHKSRVVKTIEVKPYNAEEERVQPESSIPSFSENNTEDKMEPKLASLKQADKGRRRRRKKRKSRTAKSGQTWNEAGDRLSQIHLEMMTGFFDVEKENIRMEKVLTKDKGFSRQRPLGQEHSNGTDSGVETNSLHTSTVAVDISQ